MLNYESSWDRYFEGQKFDKSEDVLCAAVKMSAFGYAKRMASIICSAFIEENEEAEMLFRTHGLDESHAYAYLGMDEELADYLMAETESNYVSAYLD